MKNYYVYILRCSDESYYTGVTNNVDRRVSEHQQGLIPDCYTHKRRPLELVFAAHFNNVRNAIEREKQIKGWSRKKKEALINSDWEKLVELSKSRPSTGSG